MSDNITPFRIDVPEADLEDLRERLFPNLHYWNELDKGGHFAAFEQPETFVNEVRASFRPLRGTHRS
jgi:hypothetical protein